MDLPRLINHGEFSQNCLEFSHQKWLFSRWSVGSHQGDVHSLKNDCLGSLRFAKWLVLYFCYCYQITNLTDHASTGGRETRYPPTSLFGMGENSNPHFKRLVKWPPRIKNLFKKITLEAPHPAISDPAIKYWTFFHCFPSKSPRISRFACLVECHQNKVQ